MHKREAAEILATYTSVRARALGRAQVTRTLIEECHTEALSAPQGTQRRQAAEAMPSWRTIRTAGRRQAGQR